MKKAFILFVTIWAATACSAFAGGKPQSTYVIITVDHCSTIPGIIDAQIDRKDCGIKAIIDICDAYHVKPTFFVSPYDAPEVGENSVKKVVQYLAKRGCDIQLHTHPGYAYDDNRPDLYQYTLEEQIEIIRFGKEKIHEWTGQYPIAHRAGDYGADRNSLVALYRNGICYDSSRFYQHRSSKLEDMNLPINGIGSAEGIIEIPVTSFEFRETSVLFGYKLPPIKKISKIDIDWADYQQMTSCITQLIDARINTITLFMHTHSFYKSANGHQTANAKIDLEDIREFEKILVWIISHPDIRIVTFKDFVQKYEQGEIAPTNNDILPIYEKQISLIQYVRKRLGINRKNISTVGFFFLVVVSIAVGMIYVVKRRKSMKPTP